MTVQPAGLGIITKSASGTNQCMDDRVSQLRLRRYALKALAGKILPEHRVSRCMHYFRTGEAHAEVWITEKQRRAHLKHVRVCGSVWDCPVCSAKISRKRGEELAQGVAGSGFSSFMVTFTIQHDKGSDLATLDKDLTKGIRSTRAGREYQGIKARYRIVGTVNDHEATYGDVNGFHPHKHVLFLSELSDAELVAAQDELTEYFTRRYGGYLADHGYMVNSHTVDVKTGVPALTRYLAKWGFEAEVTQGQAKMGRAGHYTPFQLLDLIAQGHTRYIPIFQEYARVFMGKRQLVYSKGLRKRLRLGVEKTDAELAAEGEEDSYLFAQIPWTTWKRIIKRERSGAIGKLLEVASRGDPEEFWNCVGALTDLEPIEAMRGITSELGDYSQDAPTSPQESPGEAQSSARVIPDVAQPGAVTAGRPGDPGEISNNARWYTFHHTDDG